MQDPSNYFNNQFPEHEILKCPRCDSSNTKFCYYNNYNLSQPRHYCKNCKRYWTKGGTLRNIPVGGASRKIAKRSSSSSSSSNPKRPTTTTTADVPVTSSSVPPAETFNNSKNQNQHQQTFGGTSTSTSPASYLIDSAYNQRMGIGMGIGGFGQMGQRDGVVDPKVEETSEEGRFAGFESGDISCWSGSNNDWPDLAIYTPGAGGSTFQ